MIVITIVEIFQVQAPEILFKTATAMKILITIVIMSQHIIEFIAAEVTS